VRWAALRTVVEARAASNETFLGVKEKEEGPKSSRMLAVTEKR